MNPLTVFLKTMGNSRSKTSDVVRTVVKDIKQGISPPYKINGWLRDEIVLLIIGHLQTLYMYVNSYFQKYIQIILIPISMF